MLLGRYRFLFKVGCIVVLVFFVLLRLNNVSIRWSSWTGFGEDKTLSKSTEVRIDEKIKITTTEHFIPEKTLWDWLGVLLVPLSLAGLGFFFQNFQQRQSKRQAELEREIADTNLREESLQIYFDRLSSLLLDKKLFSLAVDDPTRELILDVIRALTLSIFRRLDEDGIRKGNIIEFLYDTGLITKYQLDLRDADLSNMILNDVNLRGANLSGAYLRHARLIRVDLSNSKMNGSNLRAVNFHGSILSNADLRNADLSYADLTCANLSHANLSDVRFSYADQGYLDFDVVCSGAFLREANLCGVNLSGSILTAVDLSYANLENANLHNANLVCANLQNSNLSDIKCWIEAQLSLAELCNTILPKGCNLNADRDQVNLISIQDKDDELERRQRCSNLKIAKES